MPNSGPFLALWSGSGPSPVFRTLSVPLLMCTLAPNKYSPDGNNLKWSHHIFIESQPSDIYETTWIFRMGAGDANNWMSDESPPRMKSTSAQQYYWKGHSDNSASLEPWLPYTDIRYPTGTLVMYGLQGWTIVYIGQIFFICEISCSNFREFQNFLVNYSNMSQHVSLQVIVVLWGRAESTLGAP